MKKHFLILSLLLLFFGVKMQAQVNEISGYVVDYNTNKPLAFVNVIIKGTQSGIATDINGYFEIKSNNSFSYLEFSAVGYFDTVYKVNLLNNNQAYRIKTKDTYLNQVQVFPGINPAHRIIKNAIKNRKINNPEKNVSYRLNTYNKLLFTVDLANTYQFDSLNSSSIEYYKENMLDVDNEGSGLVDVQMESNDSTDSIGESMEEYFVDKHLYIMESVSEKIFLPPNDESEKILASRSAGMKDPILSLLFTQLQSFTFYNDFITLLGSNYVNPISRGSTSKYLFVIEDTIFDNQDTVFAISYMPKNNTNFDGMYGVLYITTDSWAIKSVTARPADAMGVNFEIQQKYEKIEDKVWFPTQLNTKFNFPGMALGISDKELFGIGNTYISNVEIDAKLRKWNFSASIVEIDGKAQYRDEEYWDLYRFTPLTQKDINTYIQVDSMMEDVDIDKFMNFTRSLVVGRVNLKYLDLDINRIINFNSFEGWKFGLGVHSNGYISDRFTIGGWGNYALKTKKWTYGGDLDVTILKGPEFQWKIAGWNSLRESGQIDFFNDNYEFSYSDIRNVLVYNKYYSVGGQTGFEWLWLKYLRTQLMFSSYDIDPAYDYQYMMHSDRMTVSFDQFKVSEAKISLRYAYNEKFIKHNGFKIIIPGKYPIVTLEYAKGISGLLNSDVTYDRVKMRITAKKDFKYLGTSRIKLIGGYITADVPHPLLFNGMGSYDKFNVDIAETFQTARLNEFTANRFAYLFFSHDFGRVINAEKFKPEIELKFNVGISKLDNYEIHSGVSLNDMSNVYTEAGIVFNNLVNVNLYTLGIGCYYRFGAYHLPDEIDNFSFTLSLKLPLSF